jgi:hypothetical protein
MRLVDVRVGGEVVARAGTLPFDHAGRWLPGLGIDRPGRRFSSSSFIAQLSAGRRCDRWWGIAIIA